MKFLRGSVRLLFIQTKRSGGSAFGLQTQRSGIWFRSGCSYMMGFPGIAVFLAAYQKEFADTASAVLLNKVKRRLFACTDMEQSQEEKNRKNGMMEGDSSIAAAYLMLYEITGEMDYLRYAEKQFQKVEDLCGQSDDYMGGGSRLLLLFVKAI